MEKLLNKLRRRKQVLKLTSDLTEACKQSFVIIIKKGNGLNSFPFSF